MRARRVSSAEDSQTMDNYLGFNSSWYVYGGNNKCLRNSIGGYVLF